MAGFWYHWNTKNEFRDIWLMLMGGGALVVLIQYGDMTNFPNLIPKIWYAIFVVFSFFVFSFSYLEWAFTLPRTFENVVFSSSVGIFSFSLLISVLDHNTSVVAAASTLILVLVTGYNVIKTNETARKQLEFQRNPIIAISVKENDSQIQIIDLIIENVGPGIAKNLRFDIHPQGFITLSGDPIEKLFFFQNGISIFPPKQKYTIHLTNLARKIYEIKEKYKIGDDHEWREKLKKELELTFVVKYENMYGYYKIDEFKVNLCIFWGLRWPDSPAG